MRQILLIAFLALSSLGFSQKIKLKVTGQKDTTVFLIKYYGKNLLYADTAQMKNGLVEFNGAKQKPGIVGLLLPGQKYFEFIYNNEEVQIETMGPDFVKNLKVKKSVENTIFMDYIKFINEERMKANELSSKRDALKKDDPEYKKLNAEIDSISKKVIAYQNKTVDDNAGKLVSKIVKMSMDIKIPEAPRNPDGSMKDSSFAYHYFREHYFDNIDLKDDRLVNTNVFHNKLDYYFSDKMLIQHPDTIVKFAYKFVDQLDQKTEVFKYSVIHITSTFEKSKIMGMDKVFVRMGERYYCSKNAEGKSPAYWMPEDKLKDLCEKVNIQKNLVQGVRPPNISLRDSSENWRDFYSLKSDYTILYFWESDCGHCKKSTPKLQRLYAEKLKARNVEVFAVSKAIGEDHDKWKKFIRDNKLTFINVAMTTKLFAEAQEDAAALIKSGKTTLQALNYQETYDVMTTPRVFILDKDKKIIGKGLSIAQLEDFMDRIQNAKDAPKIIEPDPEDVGH